jgi:hypothetical protein
MLEEEMPAQDKKEVLHMKQMINRSIGCAVSWQRPERSFTPERGRKI